MFNTADKDATKKLKKIEKDLRLNLNEHIKRWTHTNIYDYITIVRIYVLRQIDNISGYCADLAYIFWQTDNISGYCADLAYTFLANWQYFWILCRFFGKYFWILCRFFGIYFRILCRFFGIYFWIYANFSD